MFSYWMAKPPKPKPTGAPVLTTAVVSHNRIDISRTTVENGVFYELEMAPAGTNDWTVVTASMPGTYIHSGLAPETSFSYRARARSYKGYGPYSAVVTANTPAAPTTAPTTAPTLTTTSISDSQIDLGRDSVVGATSHELQSSLDQVTWTTVTAGMGTTYSHTGLSSSTTYYYRARGVNSGGPGPWSLVASDTTQAPAPAPLAAVTDPPTGWGAYTPLDVSAGGEFFLDNTTDYRIEAQTVNGNFLRLRGGQNIVIMGMTRNIGTAGVWGTGEGHVGIEFRDEPANVNSGPFGPTDGRIIHAEGVRLQSPVDSQGFILNCGSANVQLVNCRQFELTAPARFKSTDNRDGSNGYTVNHPDLIQSWGGYGGRVYGFKTLTIDGLTGYTGYQGILLQQEANASLGNVDMRRTDLYVGEFTGVEEDGKAGVNFAGGATFWKQSSYTGILTFGESVYMKHLPNMLIQGSGDYTGKTRQWLNRHSFDSTTESWIINSGETITHDTATKRDGAGALKIVETGTGANLQQRVYGPTGTKNWSTGPTGMTAQPNASAEPVLHVWVYIEAGAPGTSHAALLMVQDTGFTWHNGPAMAVTPGQWTRISYDVSGDANPGVANLSSFNRVGVQIQANGVTGDLVSYIDELGQYLDIVNPNGGTFENLFQPPSTVTTGTDTTGTFAQYPGVTGKVYSGAPPGGEHVPATLAGAAYVRP